MVGELLVSSPVSSNVSGSRTTVSASGTKWADGRRAGPVYGVQWRSWNAEDGRHIDQTLQVHLETLNANQIRAAWWRRVGRRRPTADGARACHAFFQLARGATACCRHTSTAQTCSRHCPSTSRHAAHPHVRPAGRAWKSTSFGRAGTATSTPTTEQVRAASLEPYPFRHLELAKAPRVRVLLRRYFGDGLQHHPRSRLRSRYDGWERFGLDCNGIIGTKARCVLLFPRFPRPPMGCPIIMGRRS